MSETLHEEWLEEIADMLATTKADAVIITTLTRRVEDPTTYRLAAKGIGVEDEPEIKILSQKIFEAIVSTSKAHAAGINN